MFEIGKYYTAKPEFTKLVGTADQKVGVIPARKMSGECIQITPNIVTLRFEVGSGHICESFQHSEVS